MPNVEEEFGKLNDDITRFLKEEGCVDSGDDDIEPYMAPRARPGSITPLGVRVDRGAGLLGFNSATSTIGEMDSVLTNIRAWKQKHEREMLELRQRNEHALSQVAEAVTQLEQASPLSSNTSREAVGTDTSAVATPDLWASLLSPSRQRDFNHAKVRHEEQQCQQQQKEPASGKEQASGLPPPVQLGEEDDEDLTTLLRERQERRDRILSGSATAKLGLTSKTAQAHIPVQGQAFGYPIADADAQSQQSTATRGGSGGGSSQSMSTTDQLPLVSVLRASMPCPARSQHLLGSAPSERPTTAARRRAEEAASAAVFRGQQLMSELEAELRELEGGERGRSRTDLRVSFTDRGSDVMGVGAGTATSVGLWEPGSPRSGTSMTFTANGVLGDGGNDEDADHLASSATVATAGYPHVEFLLDWSAQLQGVLAKMDALQTGYQAVAAAAATATRRPGSGNAASAGLGARVNSPGSGGTCASTAAVAGWGTGNPSGASMTSRPGSARLRLEPLPRGPCLLSSGLTGQEAATGLARIPSPSLPSSSVSAMADPALAVVAGLEGSGQGRRSRSRVRGLRGTAEGGEVCAPALKQGSVTDNRDDTRNSSCEREAAESGAGPMACAGHRIRQLRELQRQGAGGTITGGATGGGL
ncbi:hypothetical protein VaNZ11_008442 [Volvox africanus]|uniref:Uncharacterized protein n=1 Tax=Volvox africanus TaxID=51714 RepID=A0ABQ5S608_9CHLO|nr:hypothetical protein VaNZ11_008442 [Volvox africanus]